MTQQLWQRYLEWLYHYPNLGIYVDISRIRLTSELVQQLEPEFTKAFADMEALEAGAVANPDEHRQVGHYWLRAPQRAPRSDLAQAIRASIEKIETFTRDVHTCRILAPSGKPFSHLLWIGIGGSALGPQFVADALAPQSPPLQIHFIDNTDPDGMDRVFGQLQPYWEETLVAVVSKSGGTPEPNNIMAEVRVAMEQAGLKLAPQAIAVTGPGSDLDHLSQEEGWLASFPIFDWVGGRTSEFSSVGLLPAALQGISIQELLAGAAEMDQVTRNPRLKENPAALLALAWYAAGEGQGRKDMVVLPYKDRLLLFSRYLQQLVMESLGKAQDLKGNVVHQGIAVYGNKGSTDQHAYVQQLRDGVNNFFVTFIEVLEDREGPSPEIESAVTSGDYLSGFLQGTRQALYDNERDSITVTIPRVDPRSVGALVALYERAVGLYASLIHINAYHQPGVEAGKKAAATVLTLQKQVIQTVQESPGPLLLSELAAKIGDPDQVEVIYKIARHLHANQRYLQLEGDFHDPAQLRVLALHGRKQHT